MQGRVDTGNGHADALLTLLLSRADQLREPQRSEVRDGIAWLPYTYNQLLDWLPLNFIEILNAFTHLQTEGYVETDLRPCEYRPGQLVVNHLHTVSVRMRAKTVERAA